MELKPQSAWKRQSNKGLLRRFSLASISDARFVFASSSTSLSIFFAIFAAMLLTGCEIHVGSAYKPTFLQTSTSLQPLTPPTVTTKYTVDGTEIKAEVSTSTKNVTSTIKIVTHGNIIDQEAYRVTSKEISLVEAAGEKFEDSIPLLVFPYSLGDQYNWKGKLTVNNQPVDATAIVTTSDSTVSTKDKSNRAIQVQVNIQIQRKNRTEDRKLQLWFVPGMGLVKREFGSCTRENQ